MKEGIHPAIHETTITCTCGTVYKTMSTVKNLKIGICAACHPFFTGEQRFIDTAGRVDKFAQRYGSTSATRRVKPKAVKATSTEAPEVLEATEPVEAASAEAPKVAAPVEVASS